MVKKILLSLLCFVTLAAHGAVERDRSGSYSCHCEGSDCAPDFTFHYNRETLLVTADGPKWKVTGYVLRQESKAGRVLLTMPKGEWLPSVVVAIAEDGEVSAESGSWMGSMTCRRMGD